ncbi:hypothetical protein ACFQEX_23105 [Roseibium salinum]|uniref:hypothetical protein n=1 Tax=Roseibium salinum TaxID=1604349 RepID=UPI003623C2F6
MKHIAVVLVALLISSQGTAHAQQVLRLSAFDAPNLTPMATHILSNAYAQLGIRIEVVEAHPRRALIRSSSGRTDGELVRVRSVGDRFPTLLRVEVPIVTSRTFAYTNKAELRGKLPEELYRLRVGHVDGARYAVKLAEKFSEVWTARTPEQLFDMLQYGRVDIVIVSEQTGEQMIKQSGQAGIFALQPTLSEVRYYHYLHETCASRPQDRSRPEKSSAW